MSKTIKNNQQDIALIKDFVLEIKDKVRTAQYEALKSVNKELLKLYFDIGKSIVLRQEEYNWGRAVIEVLAEELNKEFAGAKGFSASNLWRMRNIYITYKDNEKLAPLAREISWSHNIIIVEKCKDNLEREFYLRMTKKYGWSKNVLIHQIENKSYEKFLLNQTNFDKAVPEKYKNQAILAVKDEYNFDFVNLEDDHLEKELEESLLKNIRKFLIEMGGDFAFIGSQYKIEIEDELFFIDLLLYHRRLRSLVAIELKSGKFKPEYAGKMQFYLNVLNDKVKLEDENASIGIIICKDKKRTIVEYTLKDQEKPIGVANYKTKSELPTSLKNILPSAKQIAEKLKIFEE